MKLLKQAPVWLGLVLVGLQCVSTATRPQTVAANPIHAEKVVDPQVGAILDRSCQDCHSANTRWPWYARVAPVSWLLARDVSKGRAKLDFSQWTEKLPSANQRMEVCDAVSNGSMPLRAYTLVHRDARLSKQDVDSICDWAATPAIPRPGVKALGPGATAETLTSSNNLQSFSKGSR